MNRELFFPAARLLGFIAAQKTAKPCRPQQRGSASDTPGPPTPGVPTKTSGARVLVVDDDEGFRKTVRCRLELDNGACGWQVAEADSLHRALEVLADQVQDVILLDLHLGDSNGMETLERIRRVAPETAIVVLTGHAPASSGATAMIKGAQDYLLKEPKSFERLPRILCHAIESQALYEQLKARQLLEAGDGLPPRVQGVCDV